MNVESIFIWIFLHILVPMDIEKLNLIHIWGNSGPDSGPYR